MVQEWYLPARPGADRPGARTPAAGTSTRRRPAPHPRTRWTALALACPGDSVRGMAHRQPSHRATPQLPIDRIMTVEVPSRPVKDGCRTLRRGGAHSCETACRSNGWKRGFLWMNQLGCADFASARRLCRRGSRQTAHRAGSCSPGWGCSPSAGSAGHRSVTSPPSSRSVRLAVRSFLVERSDPRRVGPGRPPEACGAITMSLARAGDRHVLTCGRSPCAWRSSCSCGTSEPLSGPARRRIGAGGTHVGCRHEWHDRGALCSARGAGACRWAGPAGRRHDPRRDRQHSADHG